MSSTYNGFPGNELLHALKAIASSTNATPIVVTTTTTHDLQEGDAVVVRDHATNTGANGYWQVHVVDSTHVELWAKVNSLGGSGPSVGTGVGGATGTIRGTGFKVPATLPDDGDITTAITASLINNAPEGALDRGQYMMSKMGLYRLVYENIAVANDLASAAADNTYGTGVAQDTTWKRQALAGPLTLDFFQGGIYPDVLSTDVVEAEFKTQGDASVAATLFGLGVEYFDPGAGPNVAVNAACTKVPGSTTLLQYVAASGFDRANLIVRARFFPLFGGDLFQKMQLYLAARTVAGVNSGYAFHDDLMWSVRIYRNTLLVV